MNKKWLVCWKTQWDTAFPRVGDKSYGDLGIWPFSEVFRGPVVRSMTRYLLQVKEYCCILHLLLQRRALWVLEATHSTFINGLYTEQHRKLLSLNGEVHATKQVAPLLGLYSPAVLMVLEVSAVGKDTGFMASLLGKIIMQASGTLEQEQAICSIELYAFWEIALGESLGPGEAECFMGHQVTMGPELPIMSWVLADMSDHKGRQARQ